MSSQTDPRFLRSRDAIVATARDLLLAHGPAAVTHARIAEHAGIGRATVYRHWPRTDQLLGEAMSTVPMPFFAEPSSPYRAWLGEELTSLAQQLEQNDVLAVATTLASAALWDPAMDTRRAGFADVLAVQLGRALQQAQKHGELTPMPGDNVATALALGPILYRAIIEHAPADNALIERCIASLGTWTPPS